MYRQAILAQRVTRVQMVPLDSEKRSPRGHQIQSHTRIRLWRNVLGVRCSCRSDPTAPGDSDRSVWI